MIDYSRIAIDHALFYPRGYTLKEINSLGLLNL